MVWRSPLQGGSTWQAVKQNNEKESASLLRIWWLILFKPLLAPARFGRQPHLMRQEHTSDRKESQRQEERRDEFGKPPFWTGQCCRSQTPIGLHHSITASGHFTAAVYSQCLRSARTWECCRPWRGTQGQSPPESHHEWLGTTEAAVQSRVIEYCAWTLPRGTSVGLTTEEDLQAGPGVRTQSSLRSHAGHRWICSPLEFQRPSRDNCHAPEGRGHQASDLANIHCS